MAEREDPDLEVEEEAPIEEAADEKGGDDDTERRARDLGWVPEDEWDEERAQREGRRKPAKFVSPEDFLSRSKNDVALMRANLRRIEEDNRHLRKEVGETRSDVKEMVQYNRLQAERNKKAREDAYKKGKADAEARMEKAVDDSDTPAYRAAKADLDSLEEQARQEEAAPEPVAEEPGKPEARAQPHPEVAAWVAKNKWFNEDPARHAYMVEVHKEIAAEHPGEDVNTHEYFEEAKARVVEKFPEKFNINPRRNGAGTVRAPSGDRGVGKSGDAAWFETLPAEERAAFKKQQAMFKKQNVEYTLKEFREEYA